MKHPTRWLIALALLACALAWWWNRPPPEPSYHGKPLSQWLKERDYLSLSPERLSPAGPAEVKWLTYTAEHGHTPKRRLGPFQNFLTRLRWWDAGLESIDIFDERRSAMYILAELGPEARSAIPALVRILNKDTDFGRVYTAADVLHRIGPASWPVVEDQLQHGSNLARCALLYSMWQRSGTGSVDDFNKVFYHLMNALHDPEPNIRRNAASSLAALTSVATKQAIPGVLVDQAATVLWPLPDESNRVVRDAKKTVLDHYRATQTEATPRLTALLTDPDEAKRNFARAILAEIEPASTKAEAP